MGFLSIDAAYAVAAKRDLSTAEAAVLVALAFHRNEKSGLCNPMKETLMAKTRAGERTVERALSKLKELGIISAVRKHTGSGKGGASNSWVLHLDQPATQADRSDPTKPPMTTDQTATQTDQTATQAENPSTTPLIALEQKETGTNREREECSEGFEEFWEIWPRKVGKARAEHSWKDATKAVDPSVILDAGIAYRDSPSRPDLRFIPYPANWLDRQGWNDELPPTAHHQPDPDEWGEGPESWMGLSR